MVRCLFLFLTLLSYEVAPLLGADLLATSPTVDRRPALIIGDYRLSHYLVEKYYRRYADGVRQEEQRSPSEEERTHWFEDFVAKQMLVAHASSLGYFDRSEVRSIVDRMERHMLSAPSGVFYKSIFAAHPAAAGEFDALNGHLRTVVDATIVRFNSRVSAQACLGPDFVNLPREEQTRMISKCQLLGIELSDGPQNWPHTRFTELAEVFPAITPGRWTEHVDANLGVYFIFCRGVQTRPTVSVPKSFLEQTHDQLLVRRRRLSLLVSASLSIDESIAQQLIQKIEKNFSDTGQLSQAAFSDIGDQKLCWYKIGKDDATFTVEGYRRHFNDLFVRRLPQSVADLRDSVEDMIIEDLDVRAAREQGFDKTAQFIEDRHGFAGLQALAIYEKEILAPQIKITQAELERYYDQHAEKFRVVTKVHGRILKFDTLEKASMWMRHTNERNRDMEVPPPISEEGIDLPSRQSVLGPESMEQAVVQSHDRTWHGPFVIGKEYAVFEKQRDIDIRQRPLASVIGMIHDLIMRRLLDEQIRQLAVEFATRNRIDDRVDYSRYGVSASRPSLP